MSVSTFATSYSPREYIARPKRRLGEHGILKFGTGIWKLGVPGISGILGMTESNKFEKYEKKIKKKIKHVAK